MIDGLLKEYNLVYEEYLNAFNILNEFKNNTYNQRDYEYNLFDCVSKLVDVVEIC